MTAPIDVPNHWPGSCFGCGPHNRRVVSEEERLLRVHAEIHDEAGELAAEGESAWMMVSDATMARVSGVPE